VERGRETQKVKNTVPRMKEKKKKWGPGKDSVDGVGSLTGGAVKQKQRE